MGLPVAFRKSFGGNVGVYLGACKACVTEHLLHDAKVGAAVEEVRGGCVAQSVWASRPAAGLLLELACDETVHRVLW